MHYTLYTLPISIHFTYLCTTPYTLTLVHSLYTTSLIHTAYTLSLYPSTVYAPFTLHCPYTLPYPYILPLYLYICTTLYTTPIPYTLPLYPIHYPTTPVHMHYPIPYTLHLFTTLYIIHPYTLPLYDCTVPIIIHCPYTTPICCARVPAVCCYFSIVSCATFSDHVSLMDCSITTATYLQLEFYCLLCQLLLVQWGCWRGRSCGPAAREPVHLEVQSHLTADQVWGRQAHLTRHLTHPSAIPF